MNPSILPLARWVGLLGAILLSSVASFAGLQWEAAEVRLTAGLGDREAIARFAFKNTGTTAVTVLDVLPTCDCTTAELDQRNYGPGESGTVKAVFTFGDRSGLQQKVVEIVTSDPAAPKIYLTLWVTIPEVVTCRPTLLFWAKAAATEEQSALITNLEPHRIATLALEPAAAREFIARIEPIEPGKKYRITVRPLTTVATARTQFRFIVRLEGGTEHPVAIQAVVQ